MAYNSEFMLCIYFNNCFIAYLEVTNVDSLVIKLLDFYTIQKIYMIILIL